MAEEKVEVSNMDALEPELRAAALVGMFLRDWAMLETVMGRAIQKCMGLTPTQMYVLMANIGVAQQVYILRCAAKLQLAASNQAEFLATLNEIFDDANIRNMMAHSLFMASDDGKGVWFGRLRAREELKIAHEEWSVQRFQQATTRLMKHMRVVREYVAQLAYREELVQELAKPGLGSFGSGDLFGLTRDQIAEMSPIAVADQGCG